MVDFNQLWGDAQKALNTQIEDIKKGWNSGTCCLVFRSGNWSPGETKNRSRESLRRGC